jgi:hypothetical protein
MKQNGIALTIFFVLRALHWSSIFVFFQQSLASMQNYLVYNSLNLLLTGIVVHSVAFKNKKTVKYFILYRCKKFQDH